jgi:hypothetical protein
MNKSKLQLDSNVDMAVESLTDSGVFSLSSKVCDAELQREPTETVLVRLLMEPVENHAVCNCERPDGMLDLVVAQRVLSSESG